ncbi:MAG: hypothetical protein IJB56_06470 [Alistipes sp.]|nr:hypothetical protein [Alistipes sp.]
MRLRGFILLLLGLILAVGCTHDSDIDNVGGSTDDGIATMTIDAILPNLAGTTRAVDSALGGTVNVDFKGDGHADGYVLRIIAKAYGTGDNANDIADEDVYFITKRSDLTASIKLDLKVTAGREYKVYLWADYVKEYGADGMGVDLHYNTENLPLVTLNEEYGLNDESRDALYGVIDWEATGNKALTATLTRPLAKLRMMATDADTKADKVEITYDGTLYNTLNIATGEASTTDNNTTHTLTATTLNYTDGDDGDQLKTNQTVLVDYLIVPKDGMNIGIMASFLDGSDNEINALDPITGVKLKRGHLTTLRGEMLAGGWDGSTLVEPMTIDGEWLVLNEVEELAWVLHHANTKDKNKIRITTDMDMGGNPVKPFPAWVSEFDGASHKISNFAIDGDALFTPNTDANYIDEINIHDLNIEDATIENSGHVGVLVNRVGINATFENITIKNSSATTSDGAAGGVVGYIEGGKSPALEVKFINCDLENVKSSGTLDEGIFVGRMHGYNDDEILSFDADCSADTNCAVTDFVSPYTEDNDAQWLDEGDSAFNFTKYNGWLGDEEINRGVIKFEGHRMQIKWDGKKTITPMTDDSGAYLIYSPFDLAGVRKITASPSAIYLKSDIDMNGQGTDGKYNVPSNFTKSAYSSADDNHFNPFSYVTTLDGYKDASNNYSIWNLSISQIEQERAAFILYASGTTVHKNINFRNCCTVSVHKPVETDAKAYGAILVSNVDATYTMENVHAYDCKVFALQKVGTLGSRINGTSTLKNCTVNNCYVENYECNISETFSSGKIKIGSSNVEVTAKFFPNGEVGGMYGFIQGTSTITNCKAYGTIVDAFGQNDTNATITPTWAAIVVGLAGYYKVPGRHVSTLIGDIRATGTVTLTGCSVDASSKCTNRWDQHNSKCAYIGQAYTVKFLDNDGTLTVDGSNIKLFDCRK